jgi:hypothetical protein
VFLPVTFGNIVDEEFSDIYTRMRRAIRRPFHAECPSIALAATLLRKAGNPEGFPVPHGLVEKEWQKMLCNST